MFNPLVWKESLYVSLYSFKDDQKYYTEKNEIKVESEIIFLLINC